MATGRSTSRSPCIGRVHRPEQLAELHAVVSDMTSGLSSVAACVPVASDMLDRLAGHGDFDAGAGELRELLGRDDVRRDLLCARRDRAFLRDAGASPTRARAASASATASASSTSVAYILACWASRLPNPPRRPGSRSAPAHRGRTRRSWRCRRINPVASSTRCRGAPFRARSCSTWSIEISANCEALAAAHRRTPGARRRAPEIPADDGKQRRRRVHVLRAGCRDVLRRGAAVLPAGQRDLPEVASGRDAAAQRCHPAESRS